MNVLFFARFLRQEDDTQYGVKNHNCNLIWFVYGYPKPKMSYFFNEEPIEMGGRYDSSYTRNGQATLFINKLVNHSVILFKSSALQKWFFKCISYFYFLVFD